MKAKVLKDGCHLISALLSFPNHLFQEEGLRLVTFKKRAPLSWFESRANVMSLFNCPMVDGMEPLKRLLKIIDA